MTLMRYMNVLETDTLLCFAVELSFLHTVSNMRSGAISTTAVLSHPLTVRTHSDPLTDPLADSRHADSGSIFLC